MIAANFLKPIYTSSEKRQLVSDRIKGPLVAAFRSPLKKELDRSVETLGLWIVTSSVTFIKSVNQSNIKPCLIVHLVAVWTLICFCISWLLAYFWSGETNVPLLIFYTALTSVEIFSVLFSLRFLKVLKKKICSKIKSFFNWRSFPLFLGPKPFNP